MKQIFIIFALTLLITNATNAQQPVSYSSIVEVNASKDELYRRARLWFSETFVDSKEVLRIQDKESGELVGSGAMKFNSKTFWGSEGTKGVIKYRISIFVKDSKYKYEISDFIHEGNEMNNLKLSFGLITDDKECPKELPRQTKKWENKLWVEIKEVINSDMDIVISSLQKAMQKSNDF